MTDGKSEKIIGQYYGRFIFWNGEQAYRMKSGEKIFYPMGFIPPNCEV